MKMDPLSKYLVDHNIPWNPENGQSTQNYNTMVFDFPMKAPDQAIVSSDRPALEQLEYWKMFQMNYCEHKPSFTCMVKPDEWLETGAWIYRNWDIVSGISFLPSDGGLYNLAPYENITKEQYDELIKNLPLLDFADLPKYEQDDYTTGAKEFACSGGACEI
jgi:ribonucleoside-diphosphate reductase alpha chain